MQGYSVVRKLFVCQLYNEKTLTRSLCMIGICVGSDTRGRRTFWVCWRVTRVREKRICGWEDDGGKQTESACSHMQRYVIPYSLHHLEFHSLLSHLHSILCSLVTLSSFSTLSRSLASFKTSARSSEPPLPTQTLPLLYIASVSLMRDTHKRHSCPTTPF